MDLVPSIPAMDLVLGDVVQLCLSVKFPADMRTFWLITSTLRVKQGSLTSETNSINKIAHAVPAVDADIQVKEWMVASTTVVNGRAVCLIGHTGMATQIGKIYSQIHEALQDHDDTSFKKKLNKFGEALIKIIGIQFFMPFPVFF
jgi:Ca2+-transporting ATPase